MALALGAKLSLVVVKQISKPIATFVKREAKAHPMLAIPLEYAGSTTHRLGINLQRVILGKGMLSRGSIATVAPLTREHAVDLGAELLGETVIFSIAGGTVAIEMVRQNRAKQAAERKAVGNERQQWEAFRTATLERDEMRRDIEDLKRQLAELQAQTQQQSQRSGRWFSR
ncbi:hypothetical protein KFE25_003866 [Diacronema lutheri]|uniref:Uncharacterized protein n=1 Tax=Diacronema lutheri TaxID=2081491 RepID=A0A8J5XBL8_DIALT|nr:hypothetical protein KFE25_003866 [Diacronema lutheri]